MTRTASTSTALLFLATTWIGCASAPERVGHIDVPLTAIGASGATYRLPAGSEIDLFSDTFFGDFSLDGDDPSITVDVPPGSYGALLVDPQRDTTVWPLTRTNPDGSTETVQATLDPLPQITVTENQTTPLVIRFHVAGAGAVTFAHGSIAVSINVDEAAASFQFALSVPAMVATSATVGAAAPPPLADRLPAPGSAGLSYSVVGQTTGPLVVANPGNVCAAVTATVTAAGPGQFSNLIAEATAADGAQLCFDQLGPTTAALVFQSGRFGAPATPLLSDLADRVVVNYGVEALFDAVVFDGTTLRPGALTGAHDTSLFVFAGISGFDAAGAQHLWYFLDAGGAGATTLTPR